MGNFLPKDVIRRRRVNAKKIFKICMSECTAMMGQSVYILADTFFISFSSGADGLAVLNLILPVFE